MKRILGWIGVLGGLSLAVVVGFALYSHFLVDYSLESLELALTATDRPADNSSAFGAKVYQKIVQGLAIEEAAKEDADMKNMALLELASRSLDETEERVGRERAKAYLSQTMEFKKPTRGQILKSLDNLYRAIKGLYYKVFEFLKYVQRRFSGQPAEPFDVSSYLLLTQAEEKEKKWQLDEAADLYRRFLKFYPEHPESSFVAIDLSHILVKQKKYDEAERLLRGLAVANAGMEEYELASNLLRKITDFRKRDVQITDLENLLRVHEGTPEGERIKLRLALQYLHAYALEHAQMLFKQLENAQDQKVRVKARFYLGWIYKLQAQYDQGEKVLMELTEEAGLEQEFGLGIDAQLADIYYQKNDTEKALNYYEKIAGSSQGAGAEQAQKASREAWAALADSEQAVIYYFDLNDAEKGGKMLARAGSALPTFGEVADLKSSFEKASQADLRDMGFFQLKNGKVYEAFELFKKKVTREPRDAWAHAGLATTYVLLTDLFMAHEQALLGYQILPDQFTTGVLAYVTAYQGFYDDAIELYRKALDKDASYIPVQYNLAGVYLVKKQYEEAVQLLEALDVTFKGYENIMRQKILNNLGYAKWWLGDTQTARKYFEDALAINPDFKDAKLNLSHMSENQAPEMSRLGE